MDTVLPFITKYWAFLCTGAVLLIIAILFSLGFRIGPGPELVRLGVLRIAALPEGTTAYVDIVRSVPIKDGVAHFKLMPGAHTVIVEMPGNQSWSELFHIEHATTTVLDPLMVPLEVPSEQITGTAFSSAHERVWQTLLPSRARPIMVAGGCAAVYVSGNLIIADATTTPESACTPPAFLCEHESCVPTVVYETPDAPRSVLPHPTRTDALIVASGGLLYVLELDPREPQFSAPLFKSAFVKAGLWDDTSIVASDGTRAYRIQIAP